MGTQWLNEDRCQELDIAWVKCSSILQSAAFLQLFPQLQREIIVHIVIIRVILALLDSFVTIFLVISFYQIQEILV
jgi:hypothetical protein